MNELPLVGVEDSGIDGGLRFKCNMCGSMANFVMQLELINGNRKYNTLYTQHMPFYLCEAYEYVYRKMQRSVELEDYFAGTIKENQ